MTAKRTIVALSLPLLLAVGANANLITNAGFETTPFDYSLGAGVWPSGYGYWRGDEASGVTAENGITPLAGDLMLKFDATANGGPTAYSGCEMIQLVDLSAYATYVAAGTAVATASFYVNRVAGDAETDDLFKVRLAGHGGAASSYTSGGHISFLETPLNSDSDPSTWQQITVQYAIPTNATYLAIWVAAVENRFNDSSGVEFDGHYADSVSLTVTPEPMTLALLAIGGLGVISRRRR